jgi:S1-C subfamily serine protease
VVGVTTAASAGNTSDTVDGYAIPIADAIDIAKKIESGEGGDGIQIGRAAALGISVLAADSGDVGGGYGVTVNGLVEGGAASELGIKEGDTIVGLDGQSVKSFDALKEILAKHEPGDKVSLSWLDSSGKKTTKNITLGESSVN